MNPDPPWRPVAALIGLFFALLIATAWLLLVGRCVVPPADGAGADRGTP